MPIIRSIKSISLYYHTQCFRGQDAIKHSTIVFWGLSTRGKKEKAQAFFLVGCAMLKKNLIKKNKNKLLNTRNFAFRFTKLDFFSVNKEGGTLIITILKK